jgi:hypothetical protein
MNFLWMNDDQLDDLAKQKAATYVENAPLAKVWQDGYRAARDDAGTPILLLIIFIAMLVLPQLTKVLW